MRAATFIGKWEGRGALILGGNHSGKGAHWERALI